MLLGEQGVVRTGFAAAAMAAVVDCILPGKEPVRAGLAVAATVAVGLAYLQHGNSGDHNTGSVVVGLGGSQDICRRPNSGRPIQHCQEAYLAVVEVAVAS